MYVNFAGGRQMVMHWLGRTISTNGGREQTKRAHDDLKLYIWEHEPYLFQEKGKHEFTLEMQAWRDFDEKYL